MVKKPTPPLNSLRVFEAAARHNSFVRASSELHITPAAVSHQIKNLESTLGIALFTRKQRGVMLTDTGRRYLDHIVDAFQIIERATENLHDIPVAGPITVSMSESFAQFWLIPRLSSLKNRLPEIELHVQGDSRLVGLQESEADVGIRFGTGNYSGLETEYICCDAVTILAPTKLLSSEQDSRIKALLTKYPLLVDQGISVSEPWMGWNPWLREVGLIDQNELHKIRFSDSGLALNACLVSAGICIGRVSLAYEFIQSRELKPLLPWRSTEFAYYFVTRPVDRDNLRVKAFKDWFTEEIQSFVNNLSVGLLY